LSRKYVIVVPDGAADKLLPVFGGKTIFEAAEKPNIDSISMNGRQGLCRTVPHALQPGSDVAMMAVLGYDPVKYYTGRAPIEAVAQGSMLQKMIGYSDAILSRQLMEIWLTTVPDIFPVKKARNL